MVGPVTCCVALRQDGETIVGGDSMQASTNGGFGITGNPKVWTSGMFLVATCGSVRAAQVIRYQCPLPDRLPEDHPSVIHYLSTVFATRVKTALDEAGYRADVRSTDLLVEGALLVASKKRIYTVWGDLGVTEYKEPYAAIGSGADFALGSLATRADGVKGRDRVLDALKAAEAHSAQVRGPFNLEVIR